MLDPEIINSVAQPCMTKLLKTPRAVNLQKLKPDFKEFKLNIDKDYHNLRHSSNSKL